jgi:hypothetical protein
MRRACVGIAGLLFFAGCGGSVQAGADATSAERPVATSTTSTAAGSVVCIQAAPSSPDDRCDTPGAVPAAESRSAAGDAAAKLRAALTAEKVWYADTQTYTSDKGSLRQIESSIDWDEIDVVVRADAQAICLGVAVSTGGTLAIVDIARGADAGTSYGTERCPGKLGGVPSGFDDRW